MRDVKALIDNRICCSFIDSNDAENVIFCRPFEESLYNISTFITRDEEFIHSYITESNTNYLVSDIVLQNGEVYKDVRFRLVVSESSDIPLSTINIDALGSHTSIKEPYVHQVKPISLLHENISDKIDNSSILLPQANTGDLTITKQARELEKQLIIERQRLDEENLRLSVEREQLIDERKLQKTLEDYKSELLTEYYTAGDKQREVISVKLNEAVSELDSSILERFKAQQLTLLSYLEETTSLNLVDLQESQDKQIVQLKSDITDLLVQKMDNKSIDIDRMLIERSAELKTIFSEKVITELEVYKRKLSDELSVIAATASNELFTEKSDNLTSIIKEHRNVLETIGTQTVTDINEAVNNFNIDLDSRLPALDEKIHSVTQRIEALVEEKRDVQVVVDSAKKYTDSQITKVSEDIKNYARRILDLGGGGGSVAVQYANGGTMNGDLNVTGQYLLSGISLLNILSGGGAQSNLSVDTLVVDTSANWNSAFNISTAYQGISGSFVSFGSNDEALPIIILDTNQNLQLVRLVQTSENLPQTGELSYSTTPYTLFYGGPPAWAFDVIQNPYSPNQKLWRYSRLDAQEDNPVLQTPLYYAQYDNSEPLYSLVFGSWYTTTNLQNPVDPNTFQLDFYSPYAGVPAIDYIGSAGTSTYASRSDHSHPLPTLTQLNATSQTDFNNYKTSVAASTATLLPTTVYRSTSGSFATINFIDSKYLSLTGGSLSGSINTNSSFTTTNRISSLNSQVFIDGTAPGYSLNLINRANFDPGQPLTVDGRARFVHGVSFAAGIPNFTNNSDHCHVQWTSQGRSNWQMIQNGGTSSTNKNSFLLTTVGTPANTQFFNEANIYSVDTTSVSASTVSPFLASGIKINFNTNATPVLTAGQFIQVSFNPGAVGIVANTYSGTVSSGPIPVTINGSTKFQYVLSLENLAPVNWSVAQRGTELVYVNANGVKNVRVSFSPTDINGTQVGLSGNYLGVPRFVLAEITGHDAYAGQTVILKITTATKINLAPGDYTSYVRHVLDSNRIVLSVGNAAIGFRDTSGTTGGTGWVLYKGSTDAVHQYTPALQHFYYQRFETSDTNTKTTGGNRNIALGNSAEVDGDFSYALGYKSAIFPGTAGGSISAAAILGGENNFVYANNSTAIGGQGLIVSGTNQFVTGKFNTVRGNNNTPFVVGWGTSDNNRSNILEVNTDQVTINTSVSTTGVVYASGGNSNNWNSAFTTLCANSATWVKFQPLVYNADNASDTYVNGQRFFVSTPGLYYYYQPPDDPSHPYYLIREDDGSGYRWYYKVVSDGDGDPIYAASTNDAPYPWLATWVGRSILKAPSVDRILPKPLSAADPFGNTTYFEGSSIYAAKADHSHVYPTPVQIGAAPTVHTHVISDVTNLQTTLNTISAAANDDIWTLTNTQRYIISDPSYIVYYNNSIYPIIGNNNIVDSLYSIINAGQNNNIWNNQSSVYYSGYGFDNPVGIVNNSVIAGGNNNTIKADSYDGRYPDEDSVSGEQYYANIYNASILGGQYNRILTVNPNTVPYSLFTANYNTIVGGVSGLIYNGDYNFIGSGIKNTIYGNNNSILGGQNNTLSGTNSFILGSNISVSANNYTFVNNLSSQGVVAAQGGNSNNWNSVYTTVQEVSGFWSTIITNLTATTTTTLSALTGSYVDGQRALYKVTQGGSGNITINLSNQFRIPNSSSSPLPFSTTVGYMDMLGVMYNQQVNKWDVISFVPGYF